MEDKYLLAELEYMLCAKLRPTFLAISKDNEYSAIDVIISTQAFKYMTIEKRVNSVFNLIRQYSPGILKEGKLVVVQAFTAKEIEELLEDMFT